MLTRIFQGAVYQKIIEEVINQCRGPFEEEGASADVLNDFKKVGDSWLFLTLLSSSFSPHPYFPCIVRRLHSIKRWPHILARRTLQVRGVATSLCPAAEMRWPRAQWGAPGYERARCQFAVLSLRWPWQPVRLRVTCICLCLLLAYCTNLNIAHISIRGADVVIAGMADQPVLPQGCRYAMGPQGASSAAASPTSPSGASIYANHPTSSSKWNGRETSHQD